MRVREKPPGKIRQKPERGHRAIENLPAIVCRRTGRQLTTFELYEYFKARGELWKFFRMFPPGCG
jgi:hypothetical protein